MKRTIAAALAVFAIAAPISIAGGKAYVEVSPSPPHAGDALTFSGCNYGDRAKDMFLYVYDASGVAVYNRAFSKPAGGCFSLATSFAPLAGSYEVYVFADRSAGDGGGSYNQNHATAELAFDVLA